MKIKTVLITTGAVVAAGVGASYMARNSAKNSVTTVEVIPVTSVNTASYGMSDSGTISGTIISKDTQVVNLDTTHELTDVYVQAGDKVKKGDKLLEYDMLADELKAEKAELTKLGLELSLEALKKDLATLKSGHMPNEEAEGGSGEAAADSQEEEDGEEVSSPEDSGDSSGSAAATPVGDGSIGAADTMAEAATKTGASKTASGSTVSSASVSSGRNSSGTSHVSGSRLMASGKLYRRSTAVDNDSKTDSSEEENSSQNTARTTGTAGDTTTDTTTDRTTGTEADNKTESGTGGDTTTGSQAGTSARQPEEEADSGTDREGTEGSGSSSEGTGTTIIDEEEDTAPAPAIIEENGTSSGSGDDGGITGGGDEDDLVLSIDDEESGSSGDGGESTPAIEEEEDVSSDGKDFVEPTDDVGIQTPDAIETTAGDGDFLEVEEEENRSLTPDAITVTDPEERTEEGGEEGNEEGNEEIPEDLPALISTPDEVSDDVSEEEEPVLTAAVEGDVIVEEDGDPTADQVVDPTVVDPTAEAVPENTNGNSLEIVEPDQEETSAPAIDPNQTTGETSAPVIDPNQTTGETTTPAIDPNQTTEETAAPAIDPNQTTGETSAPAITTDILATPSDGSTPETTAQSETEDIDFGGDTDIEDSTESLYASSIIPDVNEFLQNVNNITLAINQGWDALGGQMDAINSAISQFENMFATAHEYQDVDAFGETVTLYSYYVSDEVASEIGDATTDVLQSAYDRLRAYHFINTMLSLNPGRVAGGSIDANWAASNADAIRAAVEELASLPDSMWIYNPATGAYEFSSMYAAMNDAIFSGDTMIAFLSTAAQLLNSTDVLSEPETEEIQYSTEGKLLSEIQNANSKSDTGGDSGAAYTAEELAAAIAEQEKNIKETELQIREAELSLKEYKKILDGRIVYATMDGIVKSAGSTTQSTSGAFITITGKAGLYVRGTVNELELDTVNVGDMISGVSYSTGGNFSAEIVEISEYPQEQSDNSYSYSYSEGNSNASYYPFLAYIENAEGLEVDSTVDLSLSGVIANSDDESGNGSGLALEEYFIRKDGNGRNYCYVEGEDGLLEKRYVEVGANNWGIVNIKSGLTPNDKIAFPYGDGVEDGAKTVEVEYLTAVDGEDY